MNRSAGTCPTQYRTVRSFGNCNTHLFLNCLRKINWLTIYGESYIEQQLTTFINLLNAVVDLRYPLETKVIKPNVTRSNKNSEINK